MNYKDRLIIEEKELRIKTTSLGAFLTREDYKELDSEQRVLLRLQLNSMESYLYILNERLK